MHQPGSGLAKSLNGRWLWLALLMACGLLNYIDRLAIAVLQVPIKAELGLSDTELGILTGLSFAMVYTFAAVPISGLADRYSRKLIIISAVIVWSSMTFLCGLSSSFVALCIFRMGVAIGEAGCNPPGLAIIADSFSDKDRPRAIAIWHYCMPLGMLLGIGGSGLVLVYLSWRHTFMALGVIGLLLAPVLMIWLRDPRPDDDGSGEGASRNRALWGQVKSAWSSRAFRRNLWGGALLSYAYQVILNWSPPLYSRVFGMQLHDAAAAIAVVIAVGGLGGITLAAFLSVLPARHDTRWYFWLPMTTSALFAVALVAMCLARDARLSLSIAVIPFSVFNAGLPIWVTCGQVLVKTNERAMAAGLQTFLCGIIGGAGGPFLTGLLSDFLGRALGSTAEGLRWAVASAAIAAAGASLVFFSGSRRVRTELDDREGDVLRAVCPDGLATYRRKHGWRRNSSFAEARSIEVEGRS